MASAISYEKPELSTLRETGTFYFALTPTNVGFQNVSDIGLKESKRKTQQHAWSAPAGCELPMAIGYTHPWTVLTTLAR